MSLTLHARVWAAQAFPWRPGYKVRRVMGLSLPAGDDAASLVAGNDSSPAVLTTCGWCGVAPLQDRRSKFCGRKCRQSAFRLRERSGVSVIGFSWYVWALFCAGVILGAAKLTLYTGTCLVFNMLLGLALMHQIPRRPCRSCGGAS